jgi:putative membrane protein
MKWLLPLAMAALGASAAAVAANSPDHSFYKSLAEGGIAEVEAGKLAMSKAASPEVKDFGAMMVKDHTAANDQLTALAAGKDIKLPSTSSASQMASKAKLELLTGSTFDASYVKGQIAAHQQTVALLQKEIASGQDPDAKAFAQKILPTVQAHLKAINQIAASGTTKG